MLRLRLRAQVTPGEGLAFALRAGGRDFALEAEDEAGLARWLEVLQRVREDCTARRIQAAFRGRRARRLMTAEQREEAAGAGRALGAWGGGGEGGGGGDGEGGGGGQDLVRPQVQAAVAPKASADAGMAREELDGRMQTLMALMARAGAADTAMRQGQAQGVWTSARPAAPQAARPGAGAVLALYSEALGSLEVRRAPPSPLARSST